MVALADTEDLQAVMRRQMETSDLERAPRLLDIASQRVRTFTGLEFTLATSTVTLRVRNRKVRLPQRPVVAVTGVTDINNNTVSYEWDGLQIIDLASTPINSFEINLWRGGLKTVKATYQHGWSTIPEDVVGIVCDMVAAALDSPPEDVGVQSESLGPFSISTGSQYPGGVRLTQSMKDALSDYRTTPVGTANVS